MNPRLRYLLQRTPGIVVGNSGIITQRIKFEDWLPLLEMHDTKELPKVGKWVEVLKGLYNGDVGYVDSVEPWGVQLFLVPRIPASKPSNVLPFKRKRSRPCATPTLFDPLVIKQVYGVESRRVQENCYRFKGCDFEYGLILKQFDFSSISTAVHPMDLSLFSLFLESQHPKLLRDKCSFPRPLEWDFAQGDEVCLSSLTSDTDHGIINSLLMDSVEVDFGTKKGVVRVPWLDIHKVINPGDFVEITGGEYRGRTGWFDGTGRMPGETFRNVASVIEVMNIDKPLDDRIKVNQMQILSHLCSDLP